MLDTPVAVVDAARERHVAPVPDRHLERVQCELRAERERDAPADDRPAEGDDERGVHVPGSRPDIRDVGDPKAVRGGRAEDPLDKIRRARSDGRRPGRPDLLRPAIGRGPVTSATDVTLRVFSVSDELRALDRMAPVVTDAIAPAQSMGSNSPASHRPPVRLGG